MSQSMIEFVARASFKCWRAHMDKLGLLPNRNKTYEDMDGNELLFAHNNAKASIEAVKQFCLQEEINGASWEVIIENALKR